MHTCTCVHDIVHVYTCTIILLLLTPGTHVQEVMVLSCVSVCGMYIACVYVHVCVCVCYNSSVNIVRFYIPSKVHVHMAFV